MPLDKYEFSARYGWIQDKYGLSWQVILSQPEGDWRPKIIPCLLFTGTNSGKAKAAIDFYTSVFNNARLGMIAAYEEPERKGKTAFGDFMIEGEWIAAMDSPQDNGFGFNEAISFIVNCESPRENVNEVMYNVGYSDPKAFRNVFSRLTGLSPLKYRNKYNREMAV